ncbi:hypothetical protein ACIP4T_37250 [Streptomyces massasporeus]|uniref:hypothetical protein n=1 Tax=Streptomyces massasporeus TaxID=67324 RepID=UPI0036C94D37
MKNLRTVITAALVIALSSLGLGAASAADTTAKHCTGTSGTAAPATRVAAQPVTVWLAGDSTMANPGSAR